MSQASQYLEIMNSKPLGNEVLGAIPQAAALEPRSTLVVAYRSPDSLKSSERNARTHSKRQIHKLKESIAAFGFVNPVLINASGMIIAGHGRVQAAKLLRMPMVPTICLEDLTPDQIRAYAIADNRLAEDAGWDKDLLKIELLHLESLPDFDVSIVGFEVPEIDLIIDSDPLVEPTEQVPALASTAISQPGDLWILGEHKIYCGDARDASSHRTLLQGRRASVAFTDPPFNVPIDGHVGGNGKHHHREFAMASGEMSSEEFTRFLTDALTPLATSSHDGAVHFVVMDWRHMSELLEAGRRVYGTLLNLCVWTKDNGGMGSLYRSQHELIFVFKVGKAPHRNNIMLGKFGRYRTNVWQYPGANTLSRRGDDGNVLAMHPTVKPIAMVADALLDCSARGDLVLDGFLGAGSTLLAAERTRRICYGMEIDERYVDLAIRRWQDLTGEEAIHAVSGTRFNALVEKEAAHG